MTTKPKMTAHQLAAELLAGPDFPVIIAGKYQGELTCVDGVDTEISVFVSDSSSPNVYEQLDLEELTGDYHDDPEELAEVLAARAPFEAVYVWGWWTP